MRVRSWGLVRKYGDAGWCWKMGGMGNGVMRRCVIGVPSLRSHDNRGRLR